MTVIDDRFDASGQAEAGSGLSDRELIDLVRRGDASAYATLYELYAGSIRRVAVRLSRDAFEADDVVSEVFANTLRAIQRGGGPRDDFAVYALRSVRNTVAKLRTRTDSARALPTEDPYLDRPVDDQAFRVAGDVEQAFHELPDRFRAVLWSTCIEGRPPSEVAAGRADLDAGGVASLSNRARRALGRSYLRVHTHRPSRQPECGRVRGFLPGYVQHSAAPATIRRVETHLRACPECRTVRDEMVELNGKLRSAGWWSLIVAAGRQLASSIASVNAPAVATAATPIVALVVAGAVVHETGGFDTAATRPPAAVTAGAPTLDPGEPTVTDPVAVGQPPAADLATLDTMGAATPATTVPTTTPVEITAEVTTTAVAVTTPVAPVVAPVTPSTAGGPAAGGQDDADDTTGGRPADPVAPGTTTVGVAAPTGDGSGVGSIGGGVGGSGDVVGGLLDDPATVGPVVGDVVDGTTDIVGGVVATVLGTVDGVTAPLGLDTSGVTGPLGDVVDTTLMTLDDLAGSAGGVVGGLVGSILPGGSTPATTVAAAPTTTPPAATTPTTTSPTAAPTTTAAPGLLGDLLDGLLGG